MDGRSNDLVSSEPTRLFSNYHSHISHLRKTPDKAREYYKSGNLGSFVVSRSGQHRYKWKGKNSQANRSRQAQGEVNPAHHGENCFGSLLSNAFKGICN